MTDETNNRCFNVHGCVGCARVYCYGIEDFYRGDKHKLYADLCNQLSREDALYCQRFSWMLAIEGILLGLLLNTVKGSEHILEHAKLWISLALAFGGEMYALFAAHEIHLARLSLERLKNIFKGLDYRFVPPHLGAHDGARASFNVGSLVPVSLVSAWGVLPAFAVDWLSAGARPWLPLLSVGLAAVAANLILRHSPDAWQRFLLSALIFVILAAPLVIVDYWRGRVPWSLVRFALLTVAVMIVELAVGFQKRRMPRGLLQWLKSWRSGERSADKESNGHPEPSKDDKAA